MTSLSDIEKKAVDQMIPYYIYNGKLNLVKMQLKITCDTPKVLESLMIYNNYRLLWWAVEHDQFDLLNYIHDHTTERGKFLLVCHDNYKILQQFVELFVEKIKTGIYDAAAAQQMLSYFIKINPFQVTEQLNKLFAQSEALSINSSRENIVSTDNDLAKLKADYQQILLANLCESKVFEDTTTISDVTVHNLPNVIADSNYIEQPLAGELHLEHDSSHST